MEIELKYRLEKLETGQKIWTDAELSSIEELDSRHIEDYRGIYYDTQSYDLMKQDIAFRIRKEGLKSIASLKWNGQSQGSLHVREELNVNLTEEEVKEGPKAELFLQSEIGPRLMETLEGKELIPIMEVNVLRKTFRVDTGESLLEISIDEGEILTKKGKEPVREIEIELYSGEQKDLEELGEALQKKYQISPEKNSKFARGLKLLGVLQ